MQCNLVGQVLILIGYRSKRNKIVIKGQPRGMGKSEYGLCYYYIMLNFMDMITYCRYAEECPFLRGHMEKL